MSSRLFGSRSAAKPHLLQAGGLGNELLDLRADIEAAFFQDQQERAGAAGPSNPYVGQHYFNSTQGLQYIWNGSMWIPVGPQTFVYQPNGTAGGGVYTDWATFISAVGATRGTVDLLFDESFNLGGLVIPSGTWNFSPLGKRVVRWTGVTNTTALNQIRVQVATANAAVVLQGLEFWEGSDLYFVNKSTVDIITYSTMSWLKFDNVILGQDIAAGSTAFVKYAAAAGFMDLASECGIMPNNGGSGAIQATSGSVSILAGLAYTEIATNMLSGPSNKISVLATPESIIMPQANWTGKPLCGKYRGTATIDGSTGKSAAITVDEDGQPIALDSFTHIFVSVKTPANDANTVRYAALSADRVNTSGAYGTTGSFKISALSAAGGGACNTLDTSTVEWFAAANF